MRIGDLGSGSDFTPFIQHMGVPSTDIGSSGPYGVYHSVFDNYNWFIRNADPTFVYEQQQARVFGLEVLHMADTDVLPYDYRLYGREIVGYVQAAKAAVETGGGLLRRRARLRTGLPLPGMRCTRSRLRRVDRATPKTRL